MFHSSMRWYCLNVTVSSLRAVVEDGHAGGRKAFGLLKFLCASGLLFVFCLFKFKRCVENGLK